MRTGNSVSDFKDDFSCATVTIGNFDGVHLGHRDIFKKVIESAKRRDCRSLVITFTPHPTTVLYPARGFSMLTRDDKKIRIVESCGIDGLLMVPFTVAFAEKGPRSFVEDILVPIRAREVLVGHDFSFGSSRSGNVEMLGREGALLGFDVREIPEVVIDGEEVRSTNIRKIVSEGEVIKAAKLLGRRHSVSGKVIKGGGRGIKLGFPTANLGETSETPPGAGVYASITVVKGKRFRSATHVGIIPTFDIDVPGIESHLFDFNGDILGEGAEVEFVEKIRDTVRFSSVEALIAQIKKDCADARRLLADKS